jgi:prophage tail gpP-like protein
MAVQVIVENVEIIGWQSVSIVDSVASIADSFAVSTPNVADPGGLYLPINPFDPVEILDDGITELLGWCDELNTNISAVDNSLSAKGRSLAGMTLVDCSAEIKGSNLKNVNALQILQILAKPYPLKVGAAAGVDLGRLFEKFGLEPGESCFQAIQRACKARSLLPSTVTTTGGVELVKAKAKQATDDLIVGVNCKLASGRWNVKDRFSEYRVMGQSPPVRQKNGAGSSGSGTVIESVGTDGGVVIGSSKPTTIKKRDAKKTNQAIGIAHDTEVPFYRPKIIRAEKRTDSTEAEERARWEASYRAGKSTGINISVSSWKQSDGKPWTSNTLVRVTIPQFNLSSYEMLIETVTKGYSVNGGYQAGIKVVHPDTFTPPPSNDVKREGAWNERKTKTGTLIASVGRTDAGEVINKNMR